MGRKYNKRIKQKSFFFEDYTESQIEYDNNLKNLIKVPKNRIVFLFFLFTSFIFIFSIKIFYLSLFPEINIYSKKNNMNFIKTRGDIVDRKGVILARNIDVYQAGIRPKFIKDKKNLY